MEKRIPTVFMRGGTSKGLFFKGADLPNDFAERNQLFLSALGSPDPFSRQLNGMGGGTSSLSKIIIVNRSARDDADVEYTHAQVSVDKPIVDYGANCGNLSSAVGPFAVDEKMVVAEDGTVLVRLYNTNSRKIIHARFSVRQGRVVTHGDYEIPGVSGTGAKICMDYLDPGGSANRGLLPSGRIIDEVQLEASQRIRVSLVDASIPVVFVRAADLGLRGTELPETIEQDARLMSVLDQIRRTGGVLMGLGTSPEIIGLAVPKVALVACNESYRALDNSTIQSSEFDIAARVISVERVHLAVPMTVAMCLAVAMQIEGTIPNTLGAAQTKPTRIGHPSGVFPVDASVEKSNGEWKATKATIFQTARRLMEGMVWVPDNNK